MQRIKSNLIRLGLSPGLAGLGLSLIESLFML